jgi:flavin reductase (DIM6/NTAB) family NADH-FMN oxidoreductase RutF
MTVSWGGLGVLWGKNTAACFVRPQRYTYEFMEKGEYYTLSSYEPELASIHTVFGGKSGRDEDKVRLTGLTPAFADCGAPYFTQAETVIVCKKIYFADFDPENFLDKSIAANYPGKDYHRIYIGEIIEILAKE